MGKNNIFKTKKVLFCNNCEESIETLSLFELHQFECQGIQQAPFEVFLCPKCGKKYPKNEEEDHLFSHQLDEKIQKNIKNGYESDESKASNITTKLKEKYNEPLVYTLKTVDNLSKDNKQCSICLEDYKVDVECVILPCFHFFHKKCMNYWFTKDNKCPLCQLTIKVNQKENETNEKSKKNVNNNISSLSTIISAKQSKINIITSQKKHSLMDKKSIVITNFELNSTPIKKSFKTNIKKLNKKLKEIKQKQQNKKNKKISSPKKKNLIKKDKIEIRENKQLYQDTQKK